MCGENYKGDDSRRTDFKVSLADKTVTIDGCEHCVAQAKEIMDDLGFEVTEA